MVTETDKAYFACLFDTRSTVYGGASRKRIQIFFRAIESNSFAVERLAMMTGVKLSRQYKWIQSYDRRPCKQHCTEKHAHVEINNDFRSCRLGGMRMIIFLHNIKAYSLRPEYVDELMSVVMTEYRRPKDNDRIISEFQSAGWDIPDISRLGDRAA